MNPAKFLTKSRFKKLQALVNDNQYWDEYLNPFESWNEFPHGVHLAVFVEPYLSYVLKGEKTVESRFSINRSPPYKKVNRGDIVLLKHSGGPVVGICRITRVWSYELDRKSFGEIRREFTDTLCAQDPGFWEGRKHASYATLMKIKDSFAFDPFGIEKRDRRGWVVLRSRDEWQQTLDIS